MRWPASAVGLVRVASQHFRLIDASYRCVPGHRRQPDRGGAPQIRRSRRRWRSAQLNLIHHLQDQKAVATEGDPARYALAKLRLPQAHTLASGANVAIAVINSGIDVRHPELLNSIADDFDALGSNGGPHPHGTGIAGEIVAHARLMGGAPRPGPGNPRLWCNAEWR